jgi:predicted MFS family arabinose efflux permease
VLIVIALKVLPRQASRPGSFDLIGAITSIVGMGALVYGITSGGSAGWSSPVTIAFVAGGAVVLALFVLDERRAARPILPLRLFASRQRAGAAIARLTFAGAIIAFFFYTSQYFQGAYHWSALLAGLAFLPMTVVQFALGLLVPRLTPRLGSAALVLVGFVLVILGMLWLTRIGPSDTYLTSMAGPLVLIGAGQGLGFGPLTAVGVAGARSDDSGAASGLVNTAHQLGSTLGVAILTSVAAGATTIVTRTVDVYAGATVMLVIGLLAILFLALPGERVQQSRR